jgi:LPS sulfotransferase NodH
VNNLKYIVLGSYRSGTTVINESLEKHSKLKVAYEIFHTSPEPRGIEQSVSILNQLYGKSNFDFYESVYSRYVSKGYWYETKHISKEMDLRKYVNHVFSSFNGFKILYHQISLESELWNYLLNNNIKFIHVIRPNFLDIYVSFYASHLTKKWQTLPEQNTNFIKPFYINSYELENFFKMMQFLNDHFSSLLQDQNLIKINYSEIKSWEKTMHKVQDFLDLPYENLYAKYKKTIYQNKKNLIVNYDEILNYFKNTKWSCFFNTKELI